MSDALLTPLVLFAGSSLAFSCVFYHLYEEKKKETRKLKEIPKFQPDHHLLKVLKSSPHKRLQYVAVEGIVQADGESLASQFVPRCFAVVQKVTVQEHWKLWNSVTNAWSRNVRNRKETNNSVPFSLVSPGTYLYDSSVKVQSPLAASGDYLEEVHRHMKFAKEDLVDVVVQGLSGEKPVAQEEREEILKVGATITGFGEVVLEYGDVMRLQPPKDGRLYVLMSGDHKSFIERHERTAGWFKALTALLGITGTSVLAGVAFSAYNQHGGRKD
ncbi:mitochondrial ubiquitin ligase activator of nfkb 1-A [Denticeps clupeoides]|uniref:RING-type E3 ubiquitin transferase n=1 Tax=Denticeps clupeoides TaxID=299321 RepID=A0AAY4A3K4_9TELE|nr:mitochondrial ubiquitin ligase activator of nfkb 1-A-like [Denticeps clupeoides]XP_028834432.1 mitochondrial ubiquitin ligase activator of nfkb 1-A-like [Denticeps clupeoides]XP_028834433.1 mitochondrial ubiquitin ligase activator of nfkb 1-A-like [Denticeps clupeoides]